MGAAPATTLRNEASLAVVALACTVLAVCGEDPLDAPDPQSPEETALLSVIDAEIHGTVGEAPDPQPAVRVLTPAGEPLSGVEVFWRLDQPGTAASSTISGADGVAAAVWTLGGAAGVQSITASLANGAEATIEAIAEPDEVRSLELPGGVIAEVGAVSTTGIRLLDRFGNDVPLSRAVWSVGSADIADVDAAGVVFGVRPGVTDLRLEVDDTMAVTPLEVRPLLRLAKLEAGLAHFCGLTDAGEAFCWGDNANGELGAGHFSPVDGATRVLTDVQFVALSLGFKESCALSTGGVGYCWGGGHESLLGDSVNQAIAEPATIAVTEPLASINLGWAFARCAVTTSGEAYCWGHNDFGQVGLGFESNIVYRPSRLPVEDVVREVALSGENGCAVLESEGTWCWGRSIGVGRLVEEEALGEPQLPAPIAGDFDFVWLDSGRPGTCALTGDGEAFCWGFGTFVEPTSLGGHRFGAFSVGGIGIVCGILESGAAFCWDDEGQHPVELPASEVASIRAGWAFSCALDKDGAPYCWSGLADDFPQTPTRVYISMPSAPTVSAAGSR